jgi:hypothetical protein
LGASLGPGATRVRRFSRTDSKLAGNGQADAKSAPWQRCTQPIFLRQPLQKGLAWRDMLTLKKALEGCR